MSRRLSTKISSNPSFQAPTFFHELAKEDGLEVIKKNCKELEVDCNELSVQRDEVIVHQYDSYCQALEVADKFLSKFDQVESSLVHLQKQIEQALESEIPEKLDLSSGKSSYNILNSLKREINFLEHLRQLPLSIQANLDKRNYAKAVEEFLEGEKIAKTFVKDQKRLPESEASQRIKEAIFQDLGTSKTVNKWTIEETGNLLRTCLKNQFSNEEASPMELIEWLKCLKNLQEPHEVLCNLFLTQYQHQLSKSLARLEAKESANKPEYYQHHDWLSYSPDEGFESFIKNGCSTFLQNVRQMIGFYANTFISDYRDRTSPGEDTKITVAVAHLTDFCDNIFKRLRDCVLERAIAEAHRKNIESLARCYGTFYCELVTVGKLLPKINVDRPTVDQILKVAEKCCQMQLEDVHHHLENQIETLKLQLDVISLKLVDDKSKAVVKEEVNSLLKGLVYALEGKWRTCLEPLTVFMVPELMFTAQKTGFCASFKNLVLEHMIYGYLNHFWTAVENLCEEQFHPAVLLIFYRVCKEFEKCLVPYIFTTVVDKFQNPVSKPLEDPDFGERQSHETLHVFTHLDVNMCDKMIASGKKLVDRFVFVEGEALTRLILKMYRGSVYKGVCDSRGRPGVSSNIRHVVTELATVDFFVEVLLLPDELDPIVRQTPNARAYCHFGVLPATSSMLQLPSGSPLVTRPLAATDSSEKQLVRSLNRLFIDCPEFYSHVRPRKDCVVSSVVCIAAKAYSEIIRLKTFSDSGLRQVQADAYFFAVKSAKFMTDEHLVYTLLDEVVASAASRTISRGKELFSQEKLDELVSSV